MPTRRHARHPHVAALTKKGDDGPPLRCRQARHPALQGSQPSSSQDVFKSALSSERSATSFFRRRLSSCNALSRFASASSVPRQFVQQPGSVSRLPAAARHFGRGRSSIDLVYDPYNLLVRESTLTLRSVLLLFARLQTQITRYSMRRG